MRVAINGFGRIGRSAFRILNRREDVSVVAINDIAPDDALVYLLKYDTVMGRFKDSLELQGSIMKTSSNEVVLPSNAAYLRYLVLFFPKEIWVLLTSQACEPQ